MYRYRVYGITLISEIPISHLPAAGEVDSDVVVVLRVLPTAAFRSLTGDIGRDSADWFRHAVLQDGSLYLRWEHWVEFLVSPDGRSVFCGNLSNMALSSFEAYLTTFAISAALIQQGEEPLHATVVEIGHHSVGLLGQSGAGKSTLAVNLIKRGGNLITDDMLRVTFNDAIALAHSGTQRLKLSKELAERFLQGSTYCGRFCPMGGKLILQISQPTDDRGASRLSALFQLRTPVDDSEASEILLSPLDGTELFTAIASSTMNSRLNSPNRLRRQFRFAERLARTIPVYKLTYLRKYEVLNDVVDRIIAETASL